MKNICKRTAVRETREARKLRLEERRAKSRRGETGFTPVTGKRSRALVAQFQLRNPGAPLPVSPGMRSYDLLRVAPPANINRNTGKPHEHRAERARRLGIPVEQVVAPVAEKPKRTRAKKAAA